MRPMNMNYEEEDAVERYVKLGLKSKLSSNHSNNYAEACKELALILRHAYYRSPKILQSRIFDDTLYAFRILPSFPVQKQIADLAANTLLQSSEAALPKKRKSLAISCHKHAKVTCKRGGKAQQGVEAQQGLCVTQLPDDIIPVLFEHLDLRTLANAAMVRRSWYAAAQEDSIWKLLYVNFFSDLQKCLSFDKLSLRAGKNKVKSDNESLSDIVDIKRTNWREAFKETYMGLSSKSCLHYRGYCRSCKLIVWLNDAKCFKQHSGKAGSHCKIVPISLDHIVEYVLYGSVPSECSSDSDSDSDDSYVFRLRRKCAIRKFFI